MLFLLDIIIFLYYTDQCFNFLVQLWHHNDLIIKAFIKMTEFDEESIEKGALNFSETCTSIILNKNISSTSFIVTGLHLVLQLCLDVCYDLLV